MDFSVDALERLSARLVIPDFIWVCCSGEGHMSRYLEDMGRNVVSTGLGKMSYGIGLIDFIHGTTSKYRSSDKVIRETVFKMRSMRLDGYSVGILAHPPSKGCMDFAARGLERVPDGGYVMMLMDSIRMGMRDYNRVFMESRPLFVFQLLGHPEAWFIWRKGYFGNTILDWI